MRMRIPFSYFNNFVLEQTPRQSDRNRIDGGTFAALKQLVNLVGGVEAHAVPTHAENHIHIVFLLVEHLKTLVVYRQL